MKTKLYECTNSTCPLGSPTDHGRFTGGILKSQFAMLTGDPFDGADGVLPGVCTNCGKEGTEVTDG